MSRVTRPAKVHGPAQPDKPIPPHSVEGEKGVLSSIMRAPADAITKCVAAGLDSTWFHVPAFRTIYEELQDAYDSGLKIDLITFTNWLRGKEGLLGSIGGEAAVTDVQGYLHEIYDYSKAAENLPQYIEIVSRMYVRRQIIATAELATKRAYDALPDADMGDLLDETSAGLVSLRSLHGRNGTQISFRSPSEILAMPRNPHANFFGDHLLGAGRSLVIAGIGGIGKSRLLLQLLVAFILEWLWCGIETHHTRGQPWMLVQTQNSTDRLQDDLVPLKKYAGDEWPLVEKNLLIHTLETDRDLLLHLSDPKNARDLESAIRERDPIGVAFDPLNEMAVGDLSKDVDMSETCSAIGHVSRSGNPNRAILVLTHALTGLAGMRKAFGFEAAGFGRNSKVLQTWTRAQINIIPGTEDHSVLVLTCGKLNDGQAFPPLAVRFNPETKIYEPHPDFDIEGFREHVTGGKKKQGFTVEMVRELVKFPGELEIGPLGRLIEEKLGCKRSRSQELVHEARKAKVFRYNRNTETFSKVRERTG